MAKKTEKQYLEIAKKLKREKLIPDIPKLTPAQKRKLTRLYNEYSEIINADKGEFKRVYTSNANAKSLAKTGNATHGRYAWVPLKGAKKIKIKDGTIEREYSDKKSFEIFGDEFIGMLKDDDAHKAVNKKINELKKQYKNMGMAVSLSANFAGSGMWGRSFPNMGKLLNYISTFEPKGAKNKREANRIKRELIKSIEIVIQVEPR